MANYYTYRITAGVPMQVPVQGKLILVDSIGAATGVDITPMLNNQQGRTMPGRRKGFKCWTDYDALILESAVDTTVALFLSMTDVSIGFTEGAGVAITNDNASRVPVDVAGGTVNVQATNVGINNDDATAVPIRQRAADVWKVDPKLGAVFMVSPDAAAMFKVDRKRLATVVDVGVVAVGVARVQLVADAALERVRFRNTHATAQVAIGGAGVTLANAAVVLQPGDVWNEEDAPGATWYAISDTAATNVAITGLKP